MLDRIVVGRVGRQVNRPDSLRGLAWFVQVGYGLGVVESRVVENNGDHVVVRLAYRAGRSQGDMPGILVALDVIDPRPPTAQAQRAEERLGRADPADIHPGPLASGQPHAAGLSLMLNPGLVDGVDLPSVVQQTADFLTNLAHPSGDRILVAALC